VSEIIEEANIVAEPKKRSVRQFLNQYRSLGLPGARRFRRRTRLEEAARRHRVDELYIKAMVHQLSIFVKAFEELEKEENWAVTESNESVGDGFEAPKDLVWVGESDPLEIIKKAKLAAMGN
jgi:hypothetical protein